MLGVSRAAASRSSENLGHLAREPRHDGRRGVPDNLPVNREVPGDHAIAEAYDGPPIGPRAAGLECGRNLRRSLADYDEVQKNGVLD